MLAVRRTLSRGRGGDWALGQSKTRSVRGAIALPESCVTALRRHRSHQNSQRLQLAQLWIDGGFDFTGHSGQVLHVHVLVTRFKPSIRAASLPDLGFHDLRHTSATLLLGQGVLPRIVLERLGHAGIAMTFYRHSHGTTDMQRQVADSLDAAFRETG